MYSHLKLVHLSYTNRRGRAIKTDQPESTASPSFCSKEFLLAHIPNALKLMV